MSIGDESLEQVKQNALNVPYTLDGNLRPVGHSYSMFYLVQLSYIAGDRYIAASGFFIVRNEIGKKLCIAGLLFLLSVLLLDASLVSAQEKIYAITEAELMQLEENLSELSNVNEGQREKLWNLQELLKASETRLEASERNSRMLSVKLDWLSKELTEQTSSLENANRLLQEYEEEERRTKRRIERQRNTAYVLAAIAVIFCAVK